MYGSKVVLAILAVLLSVVLASCVTTGGILFPDKVSKEKEVEARVQIAIRYLQQDEIDLAIEHLKEALDTTPKSARIHEIMAIALEKVGEHKKVEYHFKKMLRYAPEYTRGMSNYGSYLMRRGKFEEAYTQFKAVTADIYYSERAIAFQQLAVCAEKLKKYEEVEPAYQRAVALDNSLTPIMLELALLKYDNAQYPKAQRYLDQYRKKIQPASAEALLLGIKLARIFEDKSSETSYVLVLKNLYPKSEEYLEYIQTIRDKK